MVVAEGSCSRPTCFLKKYPSLEFDSYCAATMPATKSLCLSYLLWLVGGMFGLHHFYLGRDRQAFVWYSTMAGCGLGWLRDFTRLPEYVAAANCDHKWKERFKRKTFEDPSFSPLRFFGQIITGSLYGVVLRATISEDIYKLSPWMGGLVPGAIALGVHLVANIGNEKGSLKFSLLGAYMISPLIWINSANLGNVIVQSAFCSSALVQWKGKSWRMPMETRRASLARRLVVFVVCCGVYSAVWTNMLAHNAYVTTADGEKVKLKEACRNFLNSPAWTETKSSAYRLWERYQKDGFSETWKDLVVTLDPEGETWACKVLGVESSASEKEISTAYRSLVKQWHPDKASTAAEKRDYQERFMDIQKAYETLSTIKTRRGEKNKKLQKADSRRDL